jgi:hypothetical protein
MLKRKEDMGHNYIYGVHRTDGENMLTDITIGFNKT